VALRFSISAVGIPITDIDIHDFAARKLADDQRYGNVFRNQPEAFFFFLKSGKLPAQAGDFFKQFFFCSFRL